MHYVGHARDRDLRKGCFGPRRLPHLGTISCRPGGRYRGGDALAYFSSSPVLDCLCVRILKVDQIEPKNRGNDATGQNNASAQSPCYDRELPRPHGSAPSPFCSEAYADTKSFGLKSERMMARAVSSQLFRVCVA